MKKSNFLKFLLSFILITFTQPVYSYAGPGIAFGALIVFITIIITFFASIFISVFRFLKIFFIKLRSIFNKRKKKSKNRKLIK